MKQLCFVTAHYNNDHSITVYAADETKVYSLKIVGFEPYFYVPISDPIPDEDRNSELAGSKIQSIQLSPEPIGDGTLEFIHEDGFPVKKIITLTPDVVRDIRDSFSSHYEADIKFIRRFLIDTGIKSGFRIENDNLDRPIHYTELIPCEYKVSLRVAYIDFEMDSTTRFPDPKNPQQTITAWAAWNNMDRQYMQVVLVDHTNDECNISYPSDDYMLVRVNNERMLLGLFQKYLEDTQPHLLAGWNIKIPDIDCPYYRARKYGLELPYRHSDWIDLCEAYQKMYHRLYNRLKDVAVEEGIFQPNELVAEEYHKEMRKSDFEKFIRYNKMDVEILVRLDEEGWIGTNLETGNPEPQVPKRLCEFFWSLRNFVGVENCSASLHNSVLVDTLMLREAFGKVVLNSGQSIQYGKEEESYRGAVVFQPPQGIFPRSEDEVLAVLDMSRYYPNIILGYGIDKLATKVIAALTMNRLEYEREMTKYEVDTREYEIYEAKRDETKYLLNSTYGYFAYQASRKHKREKAAKITEKARLGLYVIRDAAEKFGVRVLYGDTDSLIVQCKRSEIEELVLHLNDVILKQHCKSEGIPHILKLKCDRIADQGLFVEAKSKKKTAQKRYSLHIIWENGKDTDYVDITGFDYVRGNASKPTRKLQVTVNKMILKKNRSAIPSYIRALMKDMREEKYSYSDLAIPITLRKPLDKYLKTQPDYVRGSKWAVENLGLEIIGGDRVKMLYFKSPTDVICFFDDEDIKKLKLVLSRTVVLDMEKIIDRTIKKKAEQFLSLAGISWRDIEGSIDFEKWFNQ